jgi:hypothetical protein
MATFFPVKITPSFSQKNGLGYILGDFLLIRLVTVRDMD